MWTWYLCQFFTLVLAKSFTYFFLFYFFVSLMKIIMLCVPYETFQVNLKNFFPCCYSNKKEKKNSVQIINFFPSTTNKFARFIVTEKFKIDHFLWKLLCHIQLLIAKLPFQFSAIEKWTIWVICRIYSQSICNQKFLKYEMMLSWFFPPLNSSLIFFQTLFNPPLILENQVSTFNSMILDT